MDHWLRLARMAWPYRRQVVLSLVFGLAAAGLWAVELLLTFPMVTVFVEDQTLSAYVSEQVTAARARIAEWEQELGQVDRRLGLLQGRTDEVAEDKRLTLLSEQSRMQRKLTQDTRKLWLLTSFQPLVNDWLPNDPFRLLLVILGFLVVVTALKGVCTFLQDLWAGIVAERVVLDLRQGLFRRLLKWDSQSLELSSPAQLLSALTYDLQGLAHGLTTVGGRVIREPLKAAACIAAAFWVNWQLTALSLVFVPLSIWMFQQFGRRMRRAVQRVLDAMARIYKFLEESFTNARLVLAYGLQGRQRREFHQHNREFSKQSMKLVRIDALTNPATEVLGMFAVMTGVLPAAYLVLRETTSIGGIRLSEAPLDIPALTAFYALLAGVLDPVRKFSKYFTTIKQCGTAIERTFARWDQPSQIQEPATPVWLPPLETSLEFRNVHFRYASREGAPQLQRTSVLQGVSVTIPAGETVAIVGGNGSGKSTLVGLLPRLYDPAEGSVLIDGVDLRSVRLRDLRAQLALVPQEPVLFDMTIYENISYGRPRATSTDIIQAAHRAHVLEFAERMPEGLHTRVGDQGRELSGGQRQRVALARAMLRDPRLLILDEPTAAVDAGSEQLIHAALADFARGRTTLIITHHLGAALRKMVDRIIVLDRGRIAAVGQHDELLQTCPIYGRLVEARLPIAA